MSYKDLAKILLLWKIGLTGGIIIRKSEQYFEKKKKIKGHEDKKK